MADPKSSFWSSLLVFIERPNIINKRVMGCHVLNCWQISQHLNIYELMRNCSLIQIKHKLMDCKEYSNFKLSEIKSIEGSVLIVRELLLKQSLKQLYSKDSNISDSNDVNPHIIEFILIDIFNSRTIFVPKVNDNQIVPDCCYKFFLNDSNEIELEFLSESLESLWLSKTVLPKLRQWMRQELEGHEFHGSLQLIPVDDYCLTYNRLKSRYGSQLIDIWKQNETTDPLKFVFEDIAIASYLIVLWKQQNEKKGSTNKQSFVDLGCGNGLLVYLLTNEGFRGIGIDLRKRNIWDKYGSNVKLVEKVFTPSDDSLELSDYDWLIGNHSDELTPWIPYIAAKSSYSMNVFLLPCCPFDFNGRKYQRISSNVSQYHCFIQYLISVCERLGFNTQSDKLRIPSTKRICIVCDSRNYGSSDENDMKVRRMQFIHQKINDFKDYKPREKVEAVRNCTRVPKDVLNQIVNRIAGELFKDNQKLTIRCVANFLNTEMLSQLKSQCGGLQTLLRNNKHIFEVKNGFIGFTEPKSIEENANALEPKQNLKSKQCWFFRNHPKGCPLTSSQCRYIH